MPEVTLPAALFFGFTGVLAIETPANAQQRQDAPPAAAAAPSDANSGVADIIVTAQKRSESIQKTPLAVTAVDGDALRAAGVSSVGGLAASVPTLQISQSYGVANVSLRGISLNAVNFATEGSIAFHQDGVFIQRPAAVLAGFYDLQRVEVLRGPQGTLYGRNATGGAINLITADPTATTTGYIQGTFGTYYHIAGEGAISGPLIPGSDVLEYRLAFRATHHDAYGKNEFTGTPIDDDNEQAVRFKLAFRPSGRFTALLTADYARESDRRTPHFGGTSTGAPPLGVAFPSALGGAIPLGGRIPTNIRDISSDADPIHRTSFWGISLKADYDFDFGTFKSITAYRRSKDRTIGDLDQTSFNLVSNVLIVDNSKQFSQEFQLTGHTPASDWLAGLYYYHETDDGNNIDQFNNIVLNLFGVPVPVPGRITQGFFDGSQIKTDAYAAFGQYTRHIGKIVKLTVGARYSIERKAAINQGAFDLFTPFDPAVGILTPNFATVPFGLQCGPGLQTIGFAPGTCIPSKVFRSFTPKFGIEFQVTPRTLIYGSISRGFKSGTYNLGSAQPPVNPEKVTDYEIGLKTRLFDNKLRLNLAGFYYDYTDLQVNRIVVTSVVLENAASARNYGFEAEIVAKPIPTVQIDFSGAYLNTKFKRFISGDGTRPQGDGVTLDTEGNPAFNLAGNRLPQAPEFSGKIGVSLSHNALDGQFTLRGEAEYAGKVFFTPFNLDTASVGARTRFNASLHYVTDDNLWDVALNARNLGDTVRVTGGFVATPLVGGVINGYLEEPRTVDFSITRKF